MKATQGLLKPLWTTLNPERVLSEAFPMDNDSTLLRPMNVDFQLPQVSNGAKRLNYYAAILIILLVAWLVHSRRRTSKLEFPFYKASKTNWIFDAESLIKDSYTKVSLPRESSLPPT